MKIVLVSDWFAESMGYSENSLPKALAAEGAEVHLITSDLQPYFASPSYKEIYEPFLGPGIVKCVTKPFDGYTLHRLPHQLVSGKRPAIPGLSGKLAELRPDIVQAFDAGSWTTYEIVRTQPRLGFKLFLETHQHASVYPGSNWRAWLHGRWQEFIVAPTRGRQVSQATEKCYPISTDAAEIAVRYFGIAREKISVASLGVDTDLFQPATESLRAAERQRLGFATTDIVCIYTGRFTPSKDPLCLAQAVAALNAQGRPYRGLFVGGGDPEQVSAIRNCAGCIVMPFVPFRELPPYYQAADIGVWPRQESTSQLDAAAAGLPIIISDRTTVVERIAGNGLTYREGDPADLARVLLRLADESERRRRGLAGSRKMQQDFSWRRIARQRLQDYETALRK